MGYILFLDDDRPVPQWIIDDGREYVTCKNMGEFAEFLEGKGCPEHISFDHYLGHPHWTGAKIAEEFTMIVKHGWCTKQPVVLPDNFSYNIHSSSPDGAELIRTIMESFLKEMATLKGSGDQSS